jgi:hypothetical protein
MTTQVAYYGLAAAGTLSISLLSQSLTLSVENFSRPKVIQDLSVLVAEVDAGAFVQPHDPNYGLLSSATQTIKSLLNRILSQGIEEWPRPPPSTSAALGNASLPGDMETWLAWDSSGLQDFETNFWQNLAEHPFLFEP